MQTNRIGFASCMAVAVAICLGCAQSQAAQQAHTDAKTKGKYKVRLTTDAESVVGTCKFVAMIEPAAGSCRRNLRVPVPGLLPRPRRSIRGPIRSW